MVVKIEKVDEMGHGMEDEGRAINVPRPPSPVPIDYLIKY